MGEGGGVAAVFDLDRTLAALPVDIEGVRASLSAWGAPLGIVGPWQPILDALASLPDRLRPRFGAGAEALAEEAWALFDRAEALDAAASSPCPYALEALAEAERRGIPLALVTNNGRAAAEVALKAAGLDAARFVAILCRRDATPKPAPDGLRRALAALEAHRGRVQTLYVIGDAPTDLVAARALAAELSAAGRALRVVAAGVATGFCARSRLESHHPDILLDDLGGLWDKLQGSTPGSPPGD